MTWRRARSYEKYQKFYMVFMLGNQAVDCLVKVF